MIATTSDLQSEMLVGYAPTYLTSLKAMFVVSISQRTHVEEMCMHFTMVSSCSLQIVGRERFELPKTEAT